MTVRGALPDDLDQAASIEAWNLVGNMGQMRNGTFFTRASYLLLERHVTEGLSHEFDC
jgi:hypothetical protein